LQVSNVFTKKTGQVGFCPDK